MMRNREGCVRTAAFAVIAAAVLLAAVGAAHLKASAYNRATGSNVSAWDAMWLDLRVQAEPKQKERENRK